jgi:hypothetical protein
VPTAATATPDRLKGMVAVSRDSKVKPLGYIVWFSVPDEDVKLNRLRKTWGLAGLDMKPLPRDLRAVNAFKRAVSAQDGTHRDEVTGTVTETDVRLVLENSDEVLYQLSQVVRVLDEQEIVYKRAMKVHFSKLTDEIKYRSIGDVKRADLAPLMSAIQDAFEANGKTVTGSKVRTLVRHYIKDDNDEQDNMVGLGGENLRGKAGGVYFVLAKHLGQLENLAEMLHNLYEPHGRAYLYIVPLADGASERELVRRHLAQNSVAEMEEAMSKVAGLLREGRQREVRENVVKYHYRKLERFRRHAAEYAAALNEEQADVQLHMDMLNKQVRKLMAL